MSGIGLINIKGDENDYVEHYWSSGGLWIKGVIIDNKKYGYHEFYLEDGTTFDGLVGYFLDERISADNSKGYCYIWDKKEL